MGGVSSMKALFVPALLLASVSEVNGLIGYGIEMVCCKRFHFLSSSSSSCADLPDRLFTFYPIRLG